MNSGVNSSILGFIFLPLIGLGLFGIIFLFGIFSIEKELRHVKKNEKELLKEQQQYQKEFEIYLDNYVKSQKKNSAKSRETEAERKVKEAKKKKELLKKQLDETEKRDNARRAEEEKKKKEQLKKKLDETEKKDETRRAEEEKKKKELLKKNSEEKKQNAKETTTHILTKSILEIIKKTNEEKEEYKKQKSNWIEFKTIVEKNQIKKLYHFTDYDNIHQIKKMGGLYSWSYMKNKNIEIPRSASDILSKNLDRAKGLENYVRVSFVKDHPMLHVALKESRIKKSVLLEIDPEVIYWIKTKYSKENAAKSAVNVDSSIETFKHLRFDLFSKNYFNISKNEKPYFQAEVLVWENIPAKYILNLEKF